MGLIFAHSRSYQNPKTRDSATSHHLYSSIIDRDHKLFSQPRPNIATLSNKPCPTMKLHILPPCKSSRPFLPTATHLNHLTSPLLSSLFPFHSRQLPRPPSHNQRPLPPHRSRQCLRQDSLGGIFKNEPLSLLSVFGGGGWCGCLGELCYYEVCL